SDALDHPMAIAMDGGQPSMPAPARHAVDEALIALWSELLRVPEPGIHDNFFDLGGHSVLVMQLTARIHRIFHTDVPLRTVFEAATVARIADAIVAAEQTPRHAERLARL